MSHILILGAKPRSLINFRGDFIVNLVRDGHRVTAMSAPADPGVVEGLENLGAAYRAFPVNRRGLNPVEDLRTMLALRKAFSELRPDIVIAYTIKPVIWGGLALRGLRDIRFFALITGLGFTFQGQSIPRKFMTGLVARLYRAALGRAERVVFQNPDNRDTFVQRRIIREEKSRIVSGSGVNIEKFSFTKLPVTEPVFLSMGRLLGEKGFREFARAASLVKNKYPHARFQILGGEDPSSDGISLLEIKEWEKQGWVKYLGATNDVRPFLEACHVYVLASYHEGMPRTVLEAMAMGRPVITTAAVGCRETVQEGENGFLVPVKDVQALAERMIWFIQNPDSMEQMGRESRRMAEERFDVRIINQQLMEIMGLNGKVCPK